MNLIVYLHFCTIILHNAQEFCTQQLKFVWTFAQIFLSFLSLKERLEILPFVNRLILIKKNLMMNDHGRIHRTWQIS